MAGGRGSGTIGRGGRSSALWWWVRGGMRCGSGTIVERVVLTHLDRSDDAGKRKGGRKDEEKINDAK